MVWFTLREVPGRFAHSTFAPVPRTLDGYGGIGTPSTDGAMIVASAGYRKDPTKTTSTPGGQLFGFDRDGNERWNVVTQNPVFGLASITNGVVFTPLDNALTALDLRSGAKLWSYALTSSAYASPAVVPSGVYEADDAGEVYAFALPTTATQIDRRHR